MKTLKFILKTDQAFLFVALFSTIAMALILVLFKKPFQAYLLDSVWYGSLFITGLVLNFVYLEGIWSAAKKVLSEDDVLKLLEKEGFIFSDERAPIEHGGKASLPMGTKITVVEQTRDDFNRLQTEGSDKAKSEMAMLRH